MLSMREVGIVAQREIRRNIRSTKGIAMFALFLLGGIVPSLVDVAMKREMAGLGADQLQDEAKRQLLMRGLELRYGSAEIAKYLADAPLILHGLFAGTLAFLPLFILPIGFDQLAGEIQHRTIRYSAGRAERASIVVGKALGVWAVISLMVLVLHAVVWTISLTKGGVAFGPLISWGGRFWLFSVVSAAAYVGYASLVSSFFRTPIVALFVGAGVGLAIWVLNGILGFFPSTEAVTWIFPNRYDRLLVSPDPTRVLGGMALFVAWGAACVAGAAAIVRRRDI
jgi:ABC-type transport system involved in multi-copper enzyme maturation permease subunit